MKKLSPEERTKSEERKKRLDREYAAMRRATDPAYVKRERERNRENGRKYHIKSKFGITLDQWDSMLREQSGRCFLCGKALGGGTFDIHIDHDHSCCKGKRSCGKCIRGLSCIQCNGGIGHFGDNPDLLRLVADNLEEANRRLREPS